MVRRVARTILMRPSSVTWYCGLRSFAVPEFGPFWQLCVDHDVLVAMHSSNSGYARYTPKRTVATRRCSRSRRMRSPCSISCGRCRTLWCPEGFTARCIVPPRLKVAVIKFRIEVTVSLAGSAG